MNLSLYTYTSASLDSDWDDFVYASDQGTIYSYSIFLKELLSDIECWYILKNQEKVAAIAVVTNHGNVVGHDLVIYSGILYSPLDPQMNKAQVLSEQYKITNYVVNFITGKYGDILFSSYVSFTDVRPFTWFNYGNENARYFKVNIKYTAILKLEKNDFKNNMNQNPLYLSLSKSRRQEVRYGFSKGVTVENNYNLELFFDMFQII